MQYNTSSYFTVAHTFKKTTSFEFCNSACTFVSKLFLADKLQKCQDRVSERLRNSKR